MDPLTQLPFSARELTATLPLLAPALTGLLCLFADLYLARQRSKVGLGLISAGGALLTAFLCLALWSGSEDRVLVAGTLAISRFASTLALGVLLATALISLAGMHHGQAAFALSTGEPRATIAHGEFFALIQFATCGMLGLLVANDLLTLFVALEILSICVYCLTGIDRRRARSSEGAMKYFVLGAFASGFLLYGIALLYGAGHTLRLDRLAALDLHDRQVSLALVGGVLLMVGLLFKVGAVPFHAWVPDAYEGAPTATTGFMSVAVKVAAFGAALRVVAALGQSGAMGPAGAWLLWLVAGVTMIAGNAGALTQRNPRRLLAWSAIAHSGYVLVGLVALARCWDVGHAGVIHGAPSPDLVAAGKDAVGGVIYYLLGYGAANLAAFAVLCHLERGGEEVEDLADLSGLAQTQPGPAFAMTLAMISLAGIPCTAGFLGKLWVFRSGVATGDVGLVVIALVTSVLSLYYYLRVVVVMYMQEPGQGLPGELTAGRVTAPDPSRWGSRLALSVAAALILILGMYPGERLLGMVVQGARALVPS